MTRLLHDRYYAYADEHAWDLATGESVRIGELATAAAPASPGVEPLIEVLEHGRDGEPRWVVLETAAGQSSLAATRRAAAEARARGFVPIAVDVYQRLRVLLEEDLRHRTLLLIISPGTSVDLGRQALIEAAARSPRPHVLVSFRSPRPRPAGPPVCVVREARAAYGLESKDPRLHLKRQALESEDVLRHLARAARWRELCDAGRHAAAERLLREVTGALVRRQAFGPAAATLVTLGRLTLERGRAVAAEAIFGEAALHGQTAKDEPASVGARVWQAAARTDAARLTEAESLCRAAIVTGVLAADDRTRAEAALARILLNQGRIDEAAARDLDTTSDDDEVVVFAGATRTRVLLAQGELFQAGQRARELLNRAEASRLPLARVMSLGAHARVLMETGDLVLAQQSVNDVRVAARAARMPLRFARVRLAWVDALRRAGRGPEAERELRHLQRLRGVTPPLLRDAIDSRVRGDERPAPRESLSVAPHGVAATLVAMGRDEEEDREAVRRVMTFVSQSLRTSRLDVWSADGGPDSMVLSIGTGLSTTIGSRVLDAGIVIDARGGAPGGELGVPVRLGPRLVAALVARWPVDRATPAHAHELLVLTAAVASPRIEAMRLAAREAVHASTAIPELVGPSAAMADVRRAVARAAAAPFFCADRGRKRIGQGTGGEGPPSSEPATREAILRSELRRAPRRPARIGAVRARTRRFHRGRRGSARPHRGRRRRHTVPGRGRGPVAAGAGETVARRAAAGGSPRRGDFQPQG
jgi:hypothetical protein